MKGHWQNDCGGSLLSPCLLRALKAVLAMHFHKDLLNKRGTVETNTSAAVLQAGQTLPVLDWGAPHPQGIYG